MTHLKVCHLLLSLLAISAIVCGQATTNATCLTDFAWAQNALGQSPCLVAAYLESACVSTEVKVPALVPHTHYSAPTELNMCQCSSPVYALVSLCAACQGEEFVSWNDWKAACPVVYYQVYPKDIPLQTTVPAWSYMDIPDGGSFNVSGAKALAAQGIMDSYPPSVTPNISRPVPTPSSTGSSSTTGLDAHMVKTVIGILGAVLGIVLVTSLTFIALKLRKARCKKMEQQKAMKEHHIAFPSQDSEFRARILKYTAAVHEAKVSPPRSIASWHRNSMETITTITPLMSPSSERQADDSVVLPLGSLRRANSNSNLSIVPSMFESQESEDLYTPAVESSNMALAGYSPQDEQAVEIVTETGLPAGCLPPHRHYDTEVV